MLALHFAGTGGEGDVLTARCKGPGMLAGAPGRWRTLELRRTVEGGWVGIDGGEGQGAVRLREGDAELAAALLPEWAGAAVAALAPGWPRDLHEALSLWPLKGRGTIVFDGAHFLAALPELLAPGRGPVLLPGGAARLGLPTVAAAEALCRSLSVPGTAGAAAPTPLVPALAGLARLFLHGQGAWATSDIGAGPAASYEELLAASPAVGTGLVDLTRARLDGPVRTCIIRDWPFGFMHVPRTWAHGAVLRDLEPEGAAELAGCRPGDVVLEANGRPLLEAPVADAAAALQACPEATLEVVQPIVEGPFYLREASTEVLRELGGEVAEAAALDLVPRLSELLGVETSGHSLLEEVQSRPKVFAGDGGSASRLHADNVPRVQFCHVLHGTKLFAVEHDASAADAIEAGNVEVAFPVDLPLAPAQGRWLAGPGVSVAACRAGDVLCFWGGDRHCGANAAACGPCVALFHGYAWASRPGG